jgi:hypothetical protein
LEKLKGWNAELGMHNSESYNYVNFGEKSKNKGQGKCSLVFTPRKASTLINTLLKCNGRV